MNEDPRVPLASSVFESYATETVTDEPLKLTTQNGAWWTFAAGMMLVTISGSLWTFAAFSSVFKDGSSPYILSQIQLQTLTLLSTSGNYIVLDVGFLVSRRGTVSGMIYGVILASSGYFALWMLISVAKTEAPFALLAVVFFLYGHGCGAVDNSTITELVGDFPDHTGSALGCCKGMYGLSAGLLTLIAALLLESSPKPFVLMLSIYAGSIGVACIPVVSATRRVVDEPAKLITNKFFWVAVGVGVVACATCWYCLWTNARQLPLSFPSAPASAVLFSVICVGFLLLWTVTLPDKSSSDQAHGTITTRHRTTRRRELTPMEMVASVDYWVFFTIMTIGIGTGLMILNNAGQILPAFRGRYAEKDVPSFVAALSCSNSLGRLIVGNASEWLKASVARPHFLVGSLFVEMAAFFILVVVGGDAVWYAAPAILFAWGGVWILLPVLVYELFGFKEYSIKYAMTVIAGLFGGLTFSTALAGWIFDGEATKRKTFPACYAPSCFETTILTAAICTSFAMVLGIALSWRTKEVYSEPPADK